MPRPSRCRGARRDRIASAGLLVGCTALLTVAGCGGGDEGGSGSVATTGSVASSAPSSADSSSPTSVVTATSLPAPTASTGGGPAAPPPGTPQETTPSTEPAAASPLVLLPDGLGVVSFQSSYADVIAEMTAVLGEPDYVGQDVFEPAIGSMRSVSWGDLRLDFIGGAGTLFFSGYQLALAMDVAEVDGEYRFTLPEWTPEPWEEQLATEAGIGLGDTATDADAAYPTVYAARCNAEVEQTTLLADDGTVDQLFVEPQQVGIYLQRPIDGIVWAIGAQDMPNPLLCDGGVE